MVGDLLEIEHLAERSPRAHLGLEVVVARPAALVGDGIDTVITRHFEAPRLLAVKGCAARWQFCHLDDLVSALATANIDGEQLTPAELASFFVLLVVAGNETTRNAISHSLNLFTRHPDQRELLLADGNAAAAAVTAASTSAAEAKSTVPLTCPVAGL